MLDNENKKTVIALGYFDGAHKGHKKVINKAVDIAKEKGINAVAFTFSGNLRAFITGTSDKQLFSLKDRKKELLSLGVNEIYFAPVTKEFLEMDRQEFLDYLNEKYDIDCYVSGEDFTFGYKGKGNVTYLKEYAENKNQSVETIKILTLNGEKVSTTAIKNCLSNGDIKKANSLLGYNYYVSGIVERGRSVGKTLGFPTANLILSREIFSLLDGVYAGIVEVDGKTYRAVINYGARPTYNLTEKLVEAHLIDFGGDLYGKEITVQFTNKIRDIKKFRSERALKRELKKNTKDTKKGKYD